MTAGPDALGEVRTCPTLPDLAVPTLASGEPVPALSASLSAILLGIQVMHSVLGTFHHPTPTQRQRTTTPTATPSTTVPHDQLFSLPPGVVNPTKLQTFYPSEKHLKPERLRRRLGDNFDDFWMSVDPPDDLLEVSIKRKLDKYLSDDLPTLDINALTKLLRTKYSGKNGSDADGRAGGDFPDGVVDVVKSWLMQKASCPIYYKWEELGPLFWPRWVRKGLCSLTDVPLMSESAPPRAETACSWPPGMHCIPAESKRIIVLRWTCRPHRVLNSFNKFRLGGKRTRRSVPDSSESDHRLRQRMRHSALATDATERRTHNAPTSSSDTNSAAAKRRFFKNNVSLGHIFSMALFASDIKGHYRHHNSTHSGKPTKDVVTVRENGHRVSNSRKTHKTFDQHTKSSADGESTQEFNSFRAAQGRQTAESPHPLRHRHKSKSLFRRTLRDAEEEEGEEDWEEQEEGEESDNGTENWNQQSWKGKKRKLETKCSWTKIPIPITDDCYCSC